MAKRSKPEDLNEMAADIVKFAVAEGEELAADGASEGGQEKETGSADMIGKSPPRLDRPT